MITTIALSMRRSLAGARLALAACMVLLSAAQPADAASSGLFLKEPALSPDGTRLLVRDGDRLLLVDMGSRAATVVGETPGLRTPRWAPDGRSFVFSGARSGGHDVYRQALGAASPQRLTFHEYGEFVTDSSDRAIAFSSMRRDISPWPHDYPFGVEAGSDEDRAGAPWIFEIAADGSGLRKLLPGPAREARYLPNGDILYVKVQSFERPSRILNSATTSNDLWVADVRTQSHRLLVASPQNESLPTFNPADGHVYFVRDEADQSSVWKVGLAGGAPQRVVGLSGRRISGLAIAANGRAVVETMGQLYEADLAGGTVKPLVLRGADRPDPRPMALPIAGRVTSVIADGPDEALAVVAGRFARIGLKDGRFQPIPVGSGRAILLSRSAASGDVHGLVQDDRQSCLWRIPRRGKPQRRVCAPGLWAPSVSPDGTRALVEQNGALLLADLRSGRLQTVQPAASYASAADERLIGNMLHSWLPDGSGAVVAVRRTVGQQKDIVLLSFDPAAPGVGLVREGGHDERDPVVSADGRCIGWRTAQPAPASAMSKPLYWRADTRCLPAGQPGANLASRWIAFAGTAGETAPVRRLPLAETVIALSPLDEGFAALVRSEQGPSVRFCDAKSCSDFVTTDLPDAAEGSDGFAWVADDANGLAAIGRGEALAVVKGELLHHSGNRLRRIALPATIPVDRQADYAAMFDRAAYLVRTTAYSGRDLPPMEAATSAFRSRLAIIGSDQDFADHVDSYLGELDGSHTQFAFVAMPKDRERIAGVGLVWGEWSDALGGWSIADLLPGSPLIGELPKDRLAGAAVVAINGKALRWDLDPAAALVGAGPDIDLELRQTPGGATIRVRTRAHDLLGESALHLRRWQLAKAETVRKAGGGRVAYAHMQSMLEEDYNQLLADALIHPQRDRLALDTRYNNGGWLHERLLAFLSGRPLFTLEWQRHTLWKDSDSFWTGSTNMLVNGFNYSNGTETPSLFRQWKIGKLVGEPMLPTGAGGYLEAQSSAEFVISIVASPVRSPAGEVWEGGADLQPDLSVPLRPEDIVNGRDPQLERAVADLLDRPAEASSTR